MDGVSAFAIAIQLAETIKKIVEFGKAVKDAPTQIRSLFDDLEVLAAVVSQIRELDGFVACDNVAEKALLNCRSKVFKLHNAIHDAQLNLKSRSLVRRKWGAFKFALDESEIQSIRTSIEETKSTLQLAQSTSLRKLVLSTACKQDQAAADIRTLTSRVNQSITRELKYSNYIMQIDYHSVAHTDEYGVTAEGLLTENLPESISNHKMPFTNPRQDDLVQMKSTPFCPASRPFDLRLRDCQSARQFNLNTPILALRSQSRKSIVKTIRSSKVYETTEEELTIVAYPNSAGRYLGIARGMLISADSTSGWQYCMQPFRAVDETALVFEFCREGNIQGLRSLFTRNEASPWDRDPKGQTPLLVASQSLQIDVVEFLLQQGADPHAGCWNSDSEPMLVVALNKSVDIEPKLRMISLLQSHRREDYEDLTVSNIIWHILLFYRPQSDISISWIHRRAAIMKLFSLLLPFFANDNPYRADIIHITIMLCYEQEVIQYLLRTTKGYIDRKPGTSSTLHEALHRRLLDRDPSSMRLIIEKIKDLHRLEAKSYLDSRTETPTMLAMYDMKTFLAWRNMLRGLGLDTMAFVRQELQKGSLRDCGWSTSSLHEIFETKELPDPYCGPTIFGFPSCERCRDSGTKCFTTMLKVDLIWRRYLRDLRRKHWTKESKDNTKNSPIPANTSGSPTNEDFPLHLGKLSEYGNNESSMGMARRELPYRIVCSTECADGVCVAWGYEDDTDVEPDLPPYPSGVLLDSGTEEEHAIIEPDEEETCPTKNMPGAFKEL